MTKILVTVAYLSMVTSVFGAEPNQIVLHESMVPLKWLVGKWEPEVGTELGQTAGPPGAGFKELRISPSDDGETLVAEYKYFHITQLATVEASVRETITHHEKNTYRITRSGRQNGFPHAIEETTTNRVLEGHSSFTVGEIPELPPIPKLTLHRTKEGGIRATFSVAFLSRRMPFSANLKRVKGIEE